MQYIFISLFIFLLTLIVHISIFRIFKGITENATVSIFTYLSGFVLTSLVINSIYKQNLISQNISGIWFLAIPFTAIAIYLLLSAAYLVFFLAPYLGEESPTSTILILLKKRLKISKEQIYPYLTNYNLIKKRLLIMTDLGWITFSKDRYYANSRGRLIAGIINIYRKLLGWHSFG